MLVATVLNGALNLLLAPRFGHWGTVSVALLSELVLLLLLRSMVRQAVGQPHIGGDAAQ